MKALSRSLPAAALVYLVCPLFSPAAVAGDVFDGLQPELIGSELTSVLEGAELACRQDRNDASIRRCQPLSGALDSLGGVPVSSLVATFSDQRLAQVTIYFAELSFPTVKAALSVRLGEGRDASFNVRAGMAGAFTNQVILWETDDFVAIAQQYDGKIDRSSLIYGSPSALIELLKQIKSTPPGATRNL